MSSACHPWLALGIVIYLSCAVALSVRDFAQRLSPAARTKRALWGGWLRAILSSLEPPLERLRIHPLSLTYAQLGLSLAAGGLYAIGWIFLAGCFVLGSGILDVLDGSLARRTAQASRRGAFLDSVIDRYAEFLTFLGLGIFFADSVTPWMVWVMIICLFGSLMVSYTRARAEGLGTECQGGLMQRAERYAWLGVCSFLSVVANHLSCTSSHFVFVISLILLAILTNMTALSRVQMVARQLEKDRTEELTPDPGPDLGPDLGDEDLTAPLTTLPGQDTRLLGSMLVTLGTGIVLDSSYWWAGISIILAGLILVSVGWRARWQQKETHAERISQC